MKNKYTKLISACAMTLLCTSCVELTQTPQSFLTEEQFIQYPQNIGLVEKSVNGLYTNLWNNNYGYCCRMIRYSTAAGDVVPQLSKPNNDMSMLYYMTPGTATVVADVNYLWKNFWDVIVGANKIIKGTPIPKKNAEEYKAVIAEANFMRAFAYFNLVRIFGDVPLILDSSQEDMTHLPRISVQEIYDKVILPDLAIACANLPAMSRTKTSNVPSKWAAKALLTDVYITMAGWPLKKGAEYYKKAAETAKDIIEHSGLSLTKHYPDLWKQAKRDDANEHMFALHNQNGVNPSQYGKSFFPSDYYPGGWGDYFADKDFMNAYPEGERKDCTFITDWKMKDGSVKNYKNSLSKLPLIKKYRDYDVIAKNGTISQLSNGLTPIYRYADVLLMYAEASNLATNTVNDLALKCLQDVQRRAKISDDLITNTRNSKEFDDAVFKERGWEFYVENKRWFDMIRREKVEELRPTIYNNSVYKAHHHYYLPIPMEQINMTGWTNNAGY